MLGVCTLSFWAILFSNYILPDPLNSALLVLMIFFLSRERYFLAALMLAPLSVSRESSVLVAICFLAASWKKINRRVIALALFSLVAGLAIKSMMSAASLGNRHHIPFLAYMILKAPFNFCHNVLGVALWANTLPQCTPVWTTAFNLGEMHSVGVCGYRPDFQLNFFAGWLCEFGLLALLMAPFLKKLFRQPVYLQFCVAYGLTCFAIAPLIGSAIDRLIAYSWPFFLIAAPILLSERLKGCRPLWGAVLLSSLASWMYFMGEIRNHPSLSLLAIVSSVLSLAAARRTMRVTADSEDTGQWLHPRSQGLSGTKGSISRDTMRSRTKQSNLREPPFKGRLLCIKAAQPKRDSIQHPDVGTQVAGLDHEG